MGDELDDVGEADFVGDKPVGVDSWHDGGLTGRDWPTKRLRLRLMAGLCARRWLVVGTSNTGQTAQCYEEILYSSSFNHDDGLVGEALLLFEPIA